MADEMWRMTAVQQAAAVRTGEITATALLDQHLTRIAEVNPAVNAVTQVLADRAHQDAAAIDRRHAAGEEPGPLAGVPFTVKENIAVAGTPTTHGASRLRHLVAEADAPPVARLRAAGAIVIGHSNMPTLTLAGMHTRSDLFGDSVNPWDPTRTPGGSSGGDGVAVATGMATLGLGNDAGGSVRIPASFCGVTALKPTYGRMAADHRIGPDDPAWCAQTFVVDGPLARSVADLCTVFAVLAGADPRDPRALPVPLDGEPLPGPIRVAVVTDPGGLGVHPTVVAAIETAAGALQDSGYVVEPVPDVPRLPASLHAYQSLVMTEFAPLWPAIRGLLGPDAHRYIELGMAATPPVDVAEFLRLTGVRLSIQRSWGEFLQRYPLVLGPVFTQPPVAPGLESRDTAGRDLVTTAMRLCTATSFVGLPAVAVPTGVVDGLPTGIQLIGRPYREDTCLTAAAAIEHRLGILTPITPGGSAAAG
ncbi:amidase [Actinoplanes palleronii]|uniref:Indoleacetamide hydrolase n=1 Tax=Actinoplanes palleronii TaxID=113570 RepID=A0ABQ4BN72_9ACTN|nr:amidase [Actinoplanes palleronii]GIE72148.1 indoleacetamide hydrolase [Actinoplanes palleronii]